jgi:hypothetical protein
VKRVAVCFFMRWQDGSKAAGRVNPLAAGKIGVTNGKRRMKI